MKHFIFFIFFSLILSACVQNTKNQSDEVVASTTELGESVSSQSQYMLANIVDSIIAANPDYLSNDIKKKKSLKRFSQKFWLLLLLTIMFLLKYPFLMK